MTAQLSQQFRPRPIRASLVHRLRAAGCVFAEDEAAILHEAAADEAQLEALASRREAGEPLEVVVGWVDFGRLRLAVGPGVFVPRQRSTMLARAAIGSAMGHSDPVLLEAFCGVAPIAATVARAVPGIEAHVSDIDPVALKYAAENVSNVAGVYSGDLLDGVPRALEGRVTLLVSVPPYVPSTAADFLPREAREHEPARALFGGIDGLDHVRRLVNTAAIWLAPQGCVLIEMSVSQYESAADYARERGFLTRRRGEDNQTAVLELTLAVRAPGDSSAWHTLRA